MDKDKELLSCAARLSHLIESKNALARGIDKGNRTLIVQIACSLAAQPYRSALTTGQAPITKEIFQKDLLLFSERVYANLTRKPDPPPKTDEAQNILRLLIKDELITQSKALTHEIKRQTQKAKEEIIVETNDICNRIHALHEQIDRY